MISINKELINSNYHIVAYLDGLYPFGELRQAKVNALPAVSFSGRLQSPEGDASQSASEEELSPSLRFGDAPRSALLPSHKGMISVLDKAFKGEL